jgi:hypothetical protein
VLLYVLALFIRETAVPLLRGGGRGALGFDMHVSNVAMRVLEQGLPADDIQDNGSGSAGVCQAARRGRPADALEWSPGLQRPGC